MVGRMEWIVQAPDADAVAAGLVESCYRYCEGEVS